MVPLSELDGITPGELEFLGKSGISLARFEGDQLVVFKKV